MFRDLGEVLRHIEEAGVRMVDFKFVDLWGGWHHVTVPASQFNQELYEEGLGFDGSSVGFRTVSSGDMVLRPDLATGAMDPFYEVPTLSFICFTLEADTKEPFPHDPRNTAARAESYLRDCGVADSSLWAPEFEFYVFDDVWFENGINRASYRVESREAEWAATNGGRGHVIPPGGAGDRPDRAGGRGRQRDDREVRVQDGGGSQWPDGHLHAQAPVRGGGQRHALPPAPVP